MVKVDFNKDYYAILGVVPAASQEEIKKAHRQLIRLAHPDINNNSLDAEKRTIDLNEARDVLTNDQLRAEYDNVRFGARSGPVPAPYIPQPQSGAGSDVIEPPDLDPTEVSFALSRGDRAIKQVRVKVRNQGRYPNLTLAFEPDGGEFWIAHWSQVSPGSFTISTTTLDRYVPAVHEDELWVYWAEAPDRRSKLAISVITGRSPGGSSPSAPPTRQPVPASYVGRSAGSTGLSIIGLLVVLALIAGLSYGGYRLYQRFNAPGNDPNARGGAVCNNVFTKDDFAEHVEPVIKKRGNYPYALKSPIPGAPAVCYHNFDVSDATLQNRVVVSVLCGREADASWQGFMSNSGLVPFDAMQGAYIATTAENNSASEDTAMFKTTSGEVVSVKVNFLYEGKAYGNLPFVYRKEIVAAVLPVAVAQEAEKHIC